MGIVPLQYMNGETASTHALTGHETYDVHLPADIKPRQTLTVTVWRSHV
jgi:aconitate hydratase